MRNTFFIFAIIVVLYLIKLSTVQAGQAVMVLSTYQNKTYTSEVSQNDLWDTPVLSRKNVDPPVAIGQAVSLSEKALKNIVPPEDFSNWNLISIMLCFYAIEDEGSNRCYYVIRWQGGRTGTRKEANLWRDQYDVFRIIVLMDGRVVEPKPFSMEAEPKGENHNDNKEQ